MHPDWVRSLRDQCDAAEVPFFFKQWGEWMAESEIEHVPPEVDTFIDARSHMIRIDLQHYIDGDGAGAYRVGKARAGRTLDGQTWDQMPEAR